MRDINAIVIHYTDSADVSAAIIRQWHLARGWQDIGYHKVIRQDGSVEPGRPESIIGAHTKGSNTGSLGVVLTGSDRESWYPAPEQMASLQAVLREWMARYRIPASNIFLHREKTPTSCPGRLDKAKVLRLLGETGTEAGSPAKTAPRNPTPPPLPITIRRGAKGNAVALLQQRLNIHRVHVAIDSAFGPRTEAGVRSFQKARGLVIDSVVGPKTWKLLLQPPGH